MSKPLHFSSDNLIDKQFLRVSSRNSVSSFYFWLYSRLELSSWRCICGHLNIMKLCRFLVMFFVLRTFLLLLFISSNVNASLSSGVVSNDCLPAKPSNRKLKLQDDERSNPSSKNVHVGNVDLYDYSPIDPVPSSKRSIKHGPIEHRSPLIPHMPNPSPPDQPQRGGFV